MAGTGGEAPPGVELFEALRQAAYRFDFFQALRRIECAYPDRPRIGQSLRPVEDPVRLGQEPSLAFAPASLAGFDAGTEGQPPRLSVHFLGLFGPNGPLPLHLTEYVRDRERNSDDPTLRRFADLFHHRMLSLFYRAWAASRPAVHHDRPDSDRFAVYVGSLFGLGMPSLRNRDRVPDTSKLFQAGRFSFQARNAEGLAAIVSDYFGMPVDIEEFIGTWIKIPPASYLRLGESVETGTVGRCTVVGARVWDRQQKFRICFGPVTYAEYQRLLPGSATLDRLRDLVRNYMGFELDWDVRVMLSREEIPPLALGGRERLGWTTWLSARTPQHDADDLVFAPPSAPGASNGPASLGRS